MLLHDILMLRNIISVKCLGNVSWKMLEESKALPSFSKEKIPNSRQFAQSRHFRKIATGKHFVPSRISFPCDGFNTTPVIRFHEMKACLVPSVMSVIHPVVQPYFSSLLLPCGWQLAIREQPCRRLLKGGWNSSAISPALGQVPEPILSQNTAESLVITFPEYNLGTIWEEQCEVIEVILPIKCVKY